jgi:quercetin dioxygenase-like cupin family protein
MTTESTNSKGATAVVGLAENLDWFDTLPGEQMAFRVNSGDVDGAFSVIEVNVPPFTGPPLHFHKEREEFFVVLDGRFRFHCEGEEFEAGPGTTVVVPRNSVHAFVNLGPESARMMFSFVPGDIDEFFPLLGRTPAEDWTELGRKYDVWIVGDPMVAK